MAKLKESIDHKVTEFPRIEPRKKSVAPRDSEHLEKFTKDEFLKRRIIHPGMKDIEVMNAFRELRTSILPKLEKFNSIIQVSAINTGGGASFNALNLAVSCTFAQHRNALLVDCNFHNPSLANTLNVEAEFGLFDYLTDRADKIEDIIFPTSIPRLSLVPSGTVDNEEHVEFFTGENMRVFLEDVKNRYEDRIIIIDAPPLLESADGKILSEVVDYALLIIPYKGATSSAVNKMIKSIGKEKIVGMVINN